MPAITVSPVSASVITRNVGSSLRNRCSALPSRSPSARWLGEIATLMTGSGYEHVLQRAELARRGVGVTAGTVDPHDGHDIAGGGGVDFFSLVRMHADNSTETLFAAGALIEIRFAFVDGTLKDSQECQLTVRVVDDLESHPYKGLVCGRFQRDHLIRILPAFGRTSVSSGEGR